MRDLTMRIATYNIWNSQRGYPERIGHTVETIKVLDADIIGLQEVNETAWKAVSAAFPSYDKCHFFYRGDDEGLAFISKYTIIKTRFLNNDPDYPTDALVITAEVCGKEIDFATFHLTWNSEEKRNVETANLERYLKTQSGKIQFALGDMNCSEDSLGFRFLCNECSPRWHDLVKEYSKTKPGFDKEYSLDYTKNPRWKDEPRPGAPFFADRVFVRECDDSFKLKSGSLFGKEIYPETGLCASDHYGVCFEVDI